MPECATTPVLVERLPLGQRVAPGGTPGADGGGQQPGTPRLGVSFAGFGHLVRHSWPA